MKFEHWLLQIGKSERSAKSYSGAVSGVITKWAQQAGLIQNKLTDINNTKEFIDIVTKIKTLQIFKERDTKGNRMYSVALNHYENYLEDIYKEDVKDDIEEVLSDSTIGETEKSQLVNARLGQGKFRSFQIDHWQCCALTGYSDTRFLVASHIKPWRDADNIERLDRYNGLLLLPNLDKVFDLGFITFKPKGDIIISKHLEDFETMGLSMDMKLELHEEHMNYMSYHRDMVFEKGININ
jgi:predicted restriction endonuclease